MNLRAVFLELGHLIFTSTEEEELAVLYNHSVFFPVAVSSESSCSTPILETLPQTPYSPYIHIIRRGTWIPCTHIYRRGFFLALNRRCLILEIFLEPFVAT